jgi:HPt (histidine-containing phosphotransfer) domain-containing protein
MDDYITKPIDPVKVDQVLRRWIDRPDGGGEGAAADGAAGDGEPGGAESGDGVAGGSAADSTKQQIEQRLVEVFDSPTCDTAPAVRLLESFLTWGAGELVELVGAVGQGDDARTRQLAHTLKGAAGNIGAMPAAGVCGEIEQAAEAHDREAISRLLPRLTAELDRTWQVLREILASRSGG